MIVFFAISQLFFGSRTYEKYLSTYRSKIKCLIYGVFSILKYKSMYDRYKYM